ncbi:MAG TPA: phosphate ABC transporter substrate-binding protein PstS [Gryllotalpicola sp.]
MKLKNVAAVGTLALATAIALSACSGNSSDNNSSGGSSDSTSPSASAPSVDSSLTGTITAGGSSAQANAQQAWTAAFTAQAAGVKINYDKSQGSGGGVTNWLGGSYDFAGTDSALSSDQFTQAQQTCGADGGIDIPVYLSGVAIIYKLSGVSKLNLDATTIAQIFAGKITTWNDPAIAKLNSGASLPSTPITVVRRSDGSGTTANFTTYLSQADPTDWTFEAGTAWPTIPGDKSSGQQGGSGVVNTVQAGNGTIGYADQSSIGDATMASVEVGTGGTFVDYSAAGATAAFEAAAQDASQGADDLTKKLDYTKITDASSYPIPLLSYDVVCKTFKDATQGKLTKAYLSYITGAQGQQIAEKNAGAAALPDSTISEIAKSLADLK